MIALWKGRYLENDVLGAEEWARAGYDGWPDGAGSPGSTLTSSCPNNCSTAPMGPCKARFDTRKAIFQVHWSPDGNPDFFIDCVGK